MERNSPQRETSRSTVIRRPDAIRAGVLAVTIALFGGYQLTTQISQSLSQSAPATPIAAQAAHVPVAPEPAVADPVESLALEVAPGDTLDGLFRQASLSMVDLTNILALDEARKNLRILRPGDVLRIRHEDGTILALDRELDLRTSLEVKRLADGSFSAQITDLPIEHRMVTASGKIKNSLFEAAQDAHISERLIMNVAKVFEYDIDFVRDIGQGDEFAIVYEELWRDGSKLGEGDILAAEFVNRGARFTAIRYQDKDGHVGYYNHDGQPLRKAFVRAPLKFTRISSGFNPARRHPILNTIRGHQGVDYAAPKGTPVQAAGDGKIIFRGWKGGYGNTVILQHGGNVTTLYGHMSRFGNSRYGARVRQGDVIGYVGATGLATGPHLHFEYRKNGVHLNPRTVILPNAAPLSPQELTAFRAAEQPLLQRLEARTSMLAANRPAN
ncbi:MAG: peptidoglycan DD-metalloendopeptidase family protein [Gammaproteobacteria bacterium]